MICLTILTKLLLVTDRHTDGHHMDMGTRHSVVWVKMSCKADHACFGGQYGMFGLVLTWINQFTKS